MILLSAIALFLPPAGSASGILWRKGGKRREENVFVCVLFACEALGFFLLGREHKNKVCSFLVLGGNVLMDGCFMPGDTQHSPTFFTRTAVSPHWAVALGCALLSR